MKNSKLYTLLREPLLYFLFIGGVLFLVFAQLNEVTAVDNKDIIITKSDLDLLAVSWLKSAGRPPTAEEREQQLERYIREQVLYREAMVMGLDKNDVIVRQRLVKKMQYLFDDLSFVAEPTEDELTHFLKTHVAMYACPANISFRHIFFNPEQRLDVENDANKLLSILSANNIEIDTMNFGDRSLLPDSLSNERKPLLVRLFGDMFAEQICVLPVGSWQGPVESSYGLHLIYIDEKVTEQLPPLPEIRDRVETQWRKEKQKAANEIFYQSLYQRYNIIIDDAVKQAASSSLSK